MSAASESSVRLVELGDRFWQMELDMPGKSANVFTDEVLADLDRALGRLEAVPDLAGLVVISAKPEIFVAGADLVAIERTLDWTAQDIEQFCRRGQELFGRLGALPGPVVAAIHGVCVGGGLEFALACDYRLGTPDRKTMLGLPEVKLGLIPGWGGTVRLPRLVGLATAAEWACYGELHSAENGLQAGVLDALVPREALQRTARTWLSERGDQYRARRAQLAGEVASIPADLADFVAKQRERIETSRLDPGAPRVVLTQLLDSCHDELARGLRKEALAMTQVYGSEPNAALLNAFFLGEHSKKLIRSAAAIESKIQRVGVVGVGLMGGEIAALAGPQTDLVLFDAQPERARQLAAEFARRGHAAAVQVAASLHEFRSCDLIVEAIPEQIDGKRRLLAELEPCLAPDAIVATNTSVLSLADLSVGLAHPQRFCGLHFCYPVARRPVVEVIAGPSTAAETIDRAAAWLAARRRVPLRVADQPGFVVNRVLCPMLNEANHLVCQGNSPTAIDRAMRDAGFEFGPCEFIDLIGIDVSYAAALWLFPRLPTPLEPALLLHAIHRAGFRGKKTGAGYYEYDAHGERTAGPCPIAPLIQQYVRSEVLLAPEEIVHRLMLVMANQAADLLMAKTVGSERDVDLAMIQGGGVPERLGGVLHWARRQGPRELLRELQVLENDKSHRGRFRPTTGFTAWVQTKIESDG